MCSRFEASSDATKAATRWHRGPVISTETWCEQALQPSLLAVLRLSCRSRRGHTSTFEAIVRDPSRRVLLASALWRLACRSRGRLKTPDAMDARSDAPGRASAWITASGWRGPASVAAVPATH